MGDPQTNDGGSELRKTKLSARMVADLGAQYGTGGRSIRRWWAEGAPLFQPGEMPRWWAEHKTWKCPDAILHAASLVTPAPEVAASPAVAAAGEESLRIGDFVLEEGEAVGQQRRLVKALFSKLEKAYETGVGIDLHQRRYDRAAESLRKLETTEMRASERLGRLLPRELVRSEIGMAVELQRSMRESMVRRVLELCPRLQGELREHVVSAIVKVREAEELLFRNLRCIKGVEDVQNRLAA